MPISLFGSSERSKKPGFFQRVRQAITGEAGGPALQETPDLVTGEAAEVPTIAPSSEAELALFEGVETPEATPASAVLHLPAEAILEQELGPAFVASDPAAESLSDQLSPAARQAAIPSANAASSASTGRNEFGLRPVTTNFSFGGYASAEEEDNYFMERMREAVTRTRESFTNSLESVLSFTRTVDEKTLDDLEAVLLTADIGMTTTREIIGRLRTRALREQSTGAELKAMLRQELRDILNAVDQPTDHPAATPEVIMMVGVNGTGKTTTSGKLAALYGTHGRKALLCAADTFRAAAIEQLEVWASRSNVDIVKTRQGGDPSAALYDALSAARARRADIVIVDTAGRLHNKKDLMNELDKMRRTAQKLVPGAPHQTFLVMDATTGQNGMQQAKLFLEAARVTGIVLTKLDGTAKGGIVVAIAHELHLPVVFAGIGEKMQDIVPFDNDAFVDSLLGS